MWMKHVPTDNFTYNTGLWLEGKLYRFATYTGAVIERLTVHERGHVTVSGSALSKLDNIPNRLIQICLCFPKDVTV